MFAAQPTNFHSPDHAHCPQRHKQTYCLFWISSTPMCKEYTRFIPINTLASSYLLLIPSFYSPPIL